MTETTCGEWIARFLAADPPRSKSLVMTVLGDAIAPHGGAVWLGSLIELVEPLTVTERLARTSVFRLVQEGWLNASREGRRSRYALEPASLPRLQRANRRIYSAPGLGWDGRWTVLLAPNGTLPADLRATLRKELQWEGYAMLSAGVMAHPSYEPEALDDILHRNGGDGRLFAFAASTLPDVASRPVPDLVDEGWDLSAVVERFQHFVDTFTPLLELLQAGPPADAATAFAIRTLLVHAYRRVLLHDPRLPLELLPPVWPGTYAYELARAIYLRTWEAAEAHLVAALRREDPAAPSADDAFYRRFGGLSRA
ncbi:phenylacetic acid degradation operon negative regulatory protein PaaX [Massilia terrae]|uniref:Phenylacetic acid degradation operon negative regulatory protein PaaX n=1 Tax=Massilia terrae TaxID=1811224 RepID=A0ABT2D240_9BURK|nr:PaaX family transcriptional regulator C-terminal domain-containing protein [Massilia terrae]MCS0660329.1 phenylacetic acid degradation operon negative regulatory protein PaaX [Massilia terrae]